MPTLKLPNQLAKELSDITAPCVKFSPDEPEYDWNPSAYNITAVVENRATGDTKRWTSIHELVIRTKDARLWHATYEQGLTEGQYQDAFEYDGEEIIFTQVRPVPVEHIEYQAVD